MDYEQWVAQQRAERDAKHKAEQQAEREHQRFVQSMIPRDPMRYVYHEPDRCPKCHGTELKTYRTERFDGMKAHRKTCRCGHKFFLVFPSQHSNQLEAE